MKSSSIKFVGKRIVCRSHNRRVEMYMNGDSVIIRWVRVVPKEEREHMKSSLIRGCILHNKISLSKEGAVVLHVMMENFLPKNISQAETQKIFQKLNLNG